MKNTFLKTIGAVWLAILLPAMFAQIPASAQEAPDADNEQAQKNATARGGISADSSTPLQ